MRPTMFKLVTDEGATVNTVAFDRFSDDPVKGRELALTEVERMRDRWADQPAFAGRRLRVEEGVG